MLVLFERAIEKEYNIILRRYNPMQLDCCEDATTYSPHAAKTAITYTHIWETRPPLSSWKSTCKKHAPLLQIGR